ncbi:MAG: hypothetical protein VYA32_05405, partial [Planctomycetota bacterium]|nr:hypothetical protein [Planctomycetota bacterium]
MTALLRLGVSHDVANRSTVPVLFPAAADQLRLLKGRRDTSVDHAPPARDTPPACPPVHQQVAFS